MENRLSKIFNFHGQTIDLSYQAIFTLKDLVICDEEGKKKNASNPLIAGQRRSCCFLSFLITVHSYQAGPNFKHIRMTCRSFIQLPLDVDGIDVIIDNQMFKTPHILIFHLAALDNGRKPDIGTPNKYRGEIFSECCTKGFKVNFLCYVNEVLFEMVKTALKNTYSGGTTPTGMQN